MSPLTIDHLVKRSGWIVRGQVESKRSFWSASRRRIYTQITLKVTQSYKGNVSQNSSLSFVTLGGRMGRHVMRVLGAPRFEEKENVVVFLKSRGRFPMVVGMCQGKFRLKKDAQTGKVFATRSLSSVRLTKKRPRRRFLLSTLKKIIKKTKKRQEDNADEMSKAREAKP